MPKPRNLVGTTQITISTTPQVVEHLSRLVATGLYGKNPADAAERLVAKGIEALLKENVMKGLGEHK